MAADDFAGSFVYLAGGPSVESCDKFLRAFRISSALLCTFAS